MISFHLPSSPKLPTVFFDVTPLEVHFLDMPLLEATFLDNIAMLPSYFAGKLINELN